MFRPKEKKARPFSSPATTGLFSWLGNFALFYVIILALISIPFLILIVVLSIRTILDYGNWILIGILVLIAVTVIIVIQRRRQILKGFAEQKGDIVDIIQAAAREGHNVNVSFMHGLVRLDYQGKGNKGQILDGRTTGSTKALPMNTSATGEAELVAVDPVHPSDRQSQDVSLELERLSHLLDRGLVTETEFQRIKERLLKDEQEA
jgi:hypothetical protein